MAMLVQALLVRVTDGPHPECTARIGVRRQRALAHAQADDAQADLVLIALHAVASRNR